MLTPWVRSANSGSAEFSTLLGGASDRHSRVDPAIQRHGGPRGRSRRACSSRGGHPRDVEPQMLDHARNLRNRPDGRGSKNPLLRPRLTPAAPL
jgi:hypothetical protein